MKTRLLRNMSITLLLLAGILILGGLGGVLLDRIILPWLSSKAWLKGVGIIQKANERVTVINKTEQVTVKEEYSLQKTTQNVLPSVVSIVRYEVPSGQQERVNSIQASQDIQDSIRTGLLLTSDGLIVSALDETRKGSDSFRYKVLAMDGREFDAQLATIDPYSNLVFYRIDGTNMSAAPLGNSDQLENGEKIVILGNANGEYQNTFLSGIIKERDRTFTLLNSELSSSEKLEGAIMTDANVDGKYIGGPVVDVNGTVVGIANQIEKDGKKVGFILPISSVKESMDQVIAHQTITRPVFGVYYLSINREIALLNNVSINQGALVYSFTGQQGLAVLKNSPADLAGIKLGDIILSVNDELVTHQNPLSALIAKQEKGQTVQMKILRAGTELTTSVKLN